MGGDDTAWTAMDSKRGLKAVKGVLRNVPKVVAGYFMPKDTMSGHSVSGARPTLAVVASQKLPEEGYSELRSKVVLDLASIPEAQDLDVLVVNDASPLTRHDVVQHSNGIYCSSLAERAAFEDVAIIDYLDVHAIEQLVRQDGTDV